MLRRFFIIWCLILFVRQSYAQSGYDTVKVYFPINVTQLDEVSKMRLDSLAAVLQSRNILVYGYADYLGNEPANMALAIGRCRSVKDYLQYRKVPEGQILICEGIGQVERNVARTKDGYPEDRRVEIFIRREGRRPAAVATKKPAVPAKGARKMRVLEYTDRGELVPMTVIEHKRDTTPIAAAEPKPKPKKKSTLAPGEKFVTHSGFERLADLKPNDVLRIETIHFLATRHFLTEDSKPILIELLKTLEAFPELAISIEGHVCCMTGTGDALDTDTYELKLSENRARYIRDFLVSNGIEASRLEYRGFGKRHPIIAEEKTEEDAQKNRRVEIRVLRN